MCNRGSEKEVRCGQWRRRMEGGDWWGSGSSDTCVSSANMTATLPRRKLYTGSDSTSALLWVSNLQLLNNVVYLVKTDKLYKLAFKF